MTLSFCPKLEEIYRTQRTVGQSGRVFSELGALSTPNNLAVLRAMMMQHRPARTLEVGLSFGASAMAIAASHRDLEAAPQGQHVALDPFQAKVWDNAALRNLDEAGLGGYVEIREQYSSAALPALVAELREFDLIYVDGSHLFEDVFVDAYYGVRLLSEGGVILFDDCTDPHVAKVISFLQTNSDWTAELDLSPYRSDGGSARYKIARRLGRTQLRGFRRTAVEPRAWDAPFRHF